MKNSSCVKIQSGLFSITIPKRNARQTFREPSSSKPDQFDHKLLMIQTFKLRIKKEKMP
jgi:hypothetical protein